MNTKTKIKATNITLTDEIREYLYKKLAKINEVIHCDDPTLIAEIEIGKTTNHHKNGDIFRAEINLNMKGGQLRAEAQEENLYIAIDQAQAEIIRNHTKSKGRKTSMVRRGGRAIKNLIRGLMK